MIAVDVTWIARDRVGSASRERVLAALDDAERRRAARFAHEDSRLDFALGRWLARRTLEQATNIEKCRWSFVSQPSGRPIPVPQAVAAPAPFDLNITHGGGIVAVAFVRGAKVGIDAEDATRPMPSRRLERFLAKEEGERLARAAGSARSLAFWRIWTLKEACLKATGTGIAGGLASVAIDLSSGPTPQIQRWDRPEADRLQWRLWELRPRKMTLLAIACGAEPGVELGVRATEVVDA